MVYERRIQTKTDPIYVCRSRAATLQPCSTLKPRFTNLSLQGSIRVWSVHSQTAVDITYIHTLSLTMINNYCSYNDVVLSYGLKTVCLWKYYCIHFKLSFFLKINGATVIGPNTVESRPFVLKIIILRQSIQRNRPFYSYLNL